MTSAAAAPAKAAVPLDFRNPQAQHEGGADRTIHERGDPPPSSAVLRCSRPGASWRI